MISPEPENALFSCHFRRETELAMKRDPLDSNGAISRGKKSSHSREAAIGVLSRHLSPFHFFKDISCPAMSGNFTIRLKKEKEIKRGIPHDRKEKQKFGRVD